MPTLSNLQGAVFDVDDTLLNNHPGGKSYGLHERSRLVAIRTVGRRHGIPALEHFSHQANLRTFYDAKVHSIEGAIWQTFVVAKYVHTDEPDPSHPILREIVELKNQLHEAVLRQYGQEVPGATEFVSLLTRTPGTASRLAIASTASRRDIDLFFEISGLGQYFPNNRIISREQLTHFKPHPEPFNLAFATLGLSESARGHVLAIEDDPRGIMSAKAAGLFTAALTTRHHRETLAGLAVPPDLIVSSYAELKQVLGVLQNNVVND